jgi:hypothetical protein
VISELYFEISNYSCHYQAKTIELCLEVDACAWMVAILLVRHGEVADWGCKQLCPSEVARKLQLLQYGDMPDFKIVVEALHQGIGIFKTIIGQSGIESIRMQNNKGGCDSYYGLEQRTLGFELIFSYGKSVPFQGTASELHNVILKKRNDILSRKKYSSSDYTSFCSIATDLALKSEKYKTPGKVVQLTLIPSVAPATAVPSIVRKPFSDLSDKRRKVNANKMIDSIDKYMIDS